jgi:D-glycero-D-manno-heptose 1,7-bisphosphate phosphatase
MRPKAIFLDKDGTIITDVPYNTDVNRVAFNDTVTEGLRLLQSNGYLLVVISNQSGIGYGYFSVDEFDKVMNKLRSMCLDFGISINGFYYCPHIPDDRCRCRKPEPGLILKAASEMNIDLDASWMVGDILNDVEAGKRAGCKTVLINNGNETEWVPGKFRVPDFEAKNMMEAARYIVGANNSRR